MIPQEIEEIARSRKKAPKKKARAVTATGADGGTAQAALKAWRLAAAKKQGIPAFRILTDRALDAVVAGRPRTAAELAGVPGIGRAVLQKYGSEILRVLAGFEQ